MSYTVLLHPARSPLILLPPRARPPAHHLSPVLRSPPPTPPTHATSSLPTARPKAPFLPLLHASHHRARASSHSLFSQCISGALYQLLQKHALSGSANYPPIAVAGHLYLFGAIAVGLVIPVCKLNAEDWHIPLAGWGALTYAILMTSAFNYGACAWANKHSSPAFVTAFFPLQVVFTALLSSLFLGESPTVSQIVGGVAIIAGLASVTVGRVMHEHKITSEQICLLPAGSEQLCEHRLR